MQNISVGDLIEAGRVPAYPFEDLIVDYIDDDIIVLVTNARDLEVIINEKKGNCNAVPDSTASDR